ncbi:hypothetical protein [Candidatus Magnetominusculus dajiuhuensis]|uniref:hypothetical protein n=1 Tax=Candidatus Magnetominusculus dajiuhuensis TaxID=3137712 RepID=UPI003B42CDAD
MRKDGDIVDLEQEFYDSFEKEQMLAYFDFAFPKGALPGLCKISRPKEGHTKSTYFSTLFIIDTTSDSAFNEVASYARKIQWDDFRNYLPGFNSVMAMPYAGQKTETYFLEADIFIDTPIDIPKQFVLHRLYPSIEKVTGFKTGTLVFWDDIDPKKEDTAETRQSFFQNIKNFFK